MPNFTALAGAQFHGQFADDYFRCQPISELQIIRVTNAGIATIGF